MVNYYEILGLQQNAGSAEIKAAFRRLAKLYHPDKNAGGKEQFTKILKAYETLSHPVSKAAYDYKLKHLYTQKAAEKKETKKNWQFTEQELKRRQYYNEHIKKYAKAPSAQENDFETKKTYNEYKYILFATPLAVALFLLIMKLAVPGKSLANTHFKKETLRKTQLTKSSDLLMGDAPYAFVFGKAQFDSSLKHSLEIKNLTDADLIICLFAQNKFVRSRFIERGYAAEITALPTSTLTVKYCSGVNFNYAQELKEAKIFGAFTKELVFFKSTKPIHFNALNELTLLKGNNTGFERIDEKEFFNKD